MSPYWHETMCVVFAGGWVHINLLKDLYPPQVGFVFLFLSMLERIREMRTTRPRPSPDADHESTNRVGTLVCAPRPTTNPRR